MQLHPVPDHERVVFLKPLVTEHALTIRAGEPAELERIAAERNGDPE